MPHLARGSIRLPKKSACGENAIGCGAIALTYADSWHRFPMQRTVHGVESRSCDYCADCPACGTAKRNGRAE